MSVKQKCCRYHLLAAASYVVACVLVIRSANGFTGRPIFATLLASRSIIGRLVEIKIPSLLTTIHSSSCLHESYYSYEDDSNDEELFAALLDQKSKSRDTTTAATSISPDNTSQQFDEHYNYNHLANVTGPTPSIKPEEIIPFIMNALRNNDYPDKDAGLKLVWEFATDTTQYVFKNNITEFIESCHETADEFPTSFYGVAMNGQSWTMETELNRVGGESGWIATQVMKTISSDGRMRRWQWELRKNKRPPCLGCWKIESIGSSDRNGDFEARNRGDGWSD